MIPKIDLNRKGQITLFIILGMILLFSAGTFIYLNSSKNTNERFIPVQTSPIQNYVDECIKTTGEDAIRLLGNQGGYVNIPEQILNNPQSFISLDPNFFSIIPYWYYDGKTRMPTISSMEAGISDYMDEKLPICIDNFARFDKQFKITELANASANTKIGDDAVTITIKYPFEAYDYKSEKKTFNTFTSSFNVKLKKARDLAVEIMNHENENAFLENITIDLMAVDNDIPFSGLEFSCDRKSWKVSDVKRSVQDILTANFPRIRFMNTNYLPYLSSENDYGKKKNLDDAYEYFHFSVYPSKNSYADLKATAIFNPQLGLEMVARPATHDETLESSRGKGQGMLNYMCIQLYHFTYDLYFPTTIVIRDDLAFNRAGFIFRFATPVMIDHNAANRKNVGFEEMILPSRYDPQFCSRRSDGEVEITASGSDGAYFGVELDGVNISYRCINLVCPLGSTKNVDGTYKLKTTLPSGCGYGDVIAEKPGYLTAEKRMVEDEFTIPIIKLEKIKLSFREQIDNSLGQDKSLLDDETVVFHLASPGSGYERQGYYDNKNNYTIELIGDDATYFLDATLMKGDKIVGGFKGNVTIRYSDLETAREVSFGVVKKSFVPILDAEKFGLINYLEGSAYQNSLPPIFR